MTTSDLPPIDPAGAESIAKEIERLANAFFASGASPAAPGPSLNLAGRDLPASPITALTAPAAIVPPRMGPHALNVGAGGASPAVVAPPVPGVLHRPPLAATPLPKEADLRALPTVAAENLGTPTPMAFGSQGAESPVPYFLEHAGLPAGYGAPQASPGVSAPAYGALPASPGVSPSGHGHGHDRVPIGGAPSGLEGFGIPSGMQGMTGVPGAPPASVPSGMAAMPETPRPEAAHGYHPEVVRSDAPLDRSRSIFDAHAVKRDFPILRERVHGKRLVWLDNAATTQKPQSVIDRVSYYYEHENSNIHRAAHALAARATDAYEAARQKVQRFVGASSPQEIVFVRGATEGINLVAKSWGARNVGPGDEIVITWLEHHANIVPWQQLCAEKGARLRVAPVDDRGQVILEEYERLLGPRTRLVSFTQVSNALGTITPAREMIEMAHRHGALVLLDGAQAVSHMPVDVQALDCDFYSFSGHKVFAPTGIGAVYGKRSLLEAMPPWQGGGNMIQDVTFEKTTYQGAPARFEAGTGNIADAVGLGAALDWLSALGLENVKRYEHELLVYGEEQLRCVPGLTLVGTAPDKAGVLSFVLDGVRTEDVGGLLDQEGIAVRSGHHCAQPILRRFGLESTVRASLAPYNTKEDIDALTAALKRLQAGRSGGRAS